MPENIPSICRIIAERNPKRLLDIGSGFGKFGVIARETLMAQAAERGDWTPKDNLWAECVENCAFFHDLPCHKAVYDAHHHVDVKTLSDEFLKSFDLSLMIDIAEHWPKEEVFKFISRCGPVAISTPRSVYMYVEDYYGKDCPRHCSQFAHYDFLDRGGKDYSTIQSHIFLMNT